MNAWKLNGHSGAMFRAAICESLDIPLTEVYKAVKSIDPKDRTIETKDGSKYRLRLQKIR